MSIPRTSSKKPIGGLQHAISYSNSRVVLGNGVPLRLQSAQALFSGRFKSSLSVLAWRSVVALSCLVDMVVAEERNTLKQCLSIRTGLSSAQCIYS